MADKTTVGDESVDGQHDDLFALLDNARGNWSARQSQSDSDIGAAGPEKLDKHIVLETKSQPSDSTTEYENLMARLDAGDASVMGIRPGNEYPTLFTRLPIFLPVQRVKQRAMQDINTGIAFQCAFGSGIRKGPPLTIFDEDVFMALIRLRQCRTNVANSRMPVDGQPVKQEVLVDQLVCLKSEVLKQLGLSDGGKSFKRVVTSIKNLAATTIELDQKTTDRYMGRIDKGRSLRLFQVAWEIGESEALFEIQFEPVVTHWLIREYTFIKWDIRNQLTPLAKAIHRYLSSQGKHHVIALTRLSDAIGFAGIEGNRPVLFRKALEEIVGTGWLRAAGVARKRKGLPFSVETLRS